MRDDVSNGDGDGTIERMLTFAESLKAQFGDRAIEVAIQQAEKASGSTSDIWLSIARELQKRDRIAEGSAGLSVSDGDSLAI